MNAIVNGDNSLSLDCGHGCISTIPLTHPLIQEGICQSRENGRNLVKMHEHLKYMYNNSHCEIAKMENLMIYKPLKRNFPFTCIKVRI